MKILFIFIIIYLLNIVNSELCPPNGLVFKLEEETCKNGQVIGVPTLIIDNFYDYSSITLDPPPVSAIYNQNKYQIKLNFSTTYNISAVNSNCDYIQPINITTKSGPRLVIDQPKCLNSYATVDFDDGGSGSSSSRTYQLSIQQIQLPYEMEYQSYYSHYIEVYSDGVLECHTSFYLHQGDTEKLPDFQVFSAECGANGRILIANEADYSSISLYDSSNVLVNPTSGTGNFESLAPGDYYVIVVSSECGKQKFDLTVDNAPPPYTISLLDDSCPKRPIYMIDVSNRNGIQVYLDRALSTNPFVRENDKQVSIDIPSCGTFNIPFNNIYSYPPVHYSVSANTFCQQQVKLEYNSTLVTDLKIEYFNTNNQQSNPVTMLDSTSFIAYDPSMFVYLLSSDCYSEPIKFTTAKRIPYATISKKTSYCNEIVDIKITNWMDFDTLYYYRAAEYVEIVNGEINQVPNTVFEIYYKPYGYCNTETIFINSEAFHYFANVYTSSMVTKYPECGSFTPADGTLETKIFDASTNQLLMTASDSIYIYDRSPLYTNHSVFDDFFCIAILSIDYTIPPPNVTITTVTKPICNYQQAGGFISIDSSIPIDSVEINGENLGSVDFSSIEVKAGYNYIQVIFSFYCDDYVTSYFVESLYPDFKVEYDIIPVKNCVEGVGGFTIRDYSKYSYLGMDGITLSQGTTGANYPSRTYPLEFAIQLGSDSSQICSGIVDIFVSSSIQVTASYRVVQKPLCDGDTNGVVVIDSIKSQSGTEYSVDYVDGNPNYIRGLSNGVHQLNVQSGQCSWNINVTVPIANVKITPVLDNYQVENCIGKSRYKLEFSDDYAASNFIEGENADPITKFYIYSDDNDREYYFGYGGGCYQNIVAKSIKPTLPSIKYSISLNGSPDCLSSSTLINIQVENYKEYESLKYGETSIDSDGYFTNVLPGNSIVGKLFNLDCTLNEQVVVSEPIISYSAFNETCNQGYNGELIINDIDKSKYFYLLENMDDPDENNYKSTYPVLVNSESQFGLLGSNKIRISRISKANPSCKVSSDFELTSVEPELIVNVNDQCDLELGSISIITDPSGLTSKYELGDPSTPRPTTTPSQTTMPPLVNAENFIYDVMVDYTDIASNISAGNYSLTYTITSEFCKRKYFSFVNVPLSSGVSVAATACETIQFTPIVLNSTYYYQIFKPNQESTEIFNNTGIFEFKSFDQSGSYILQVSTGTCIKNHTIQIEKCNSGGGSKIGLIVGLVIGLVALAGIIALGIFIYKKRRLSSTKVNDVEGIQHELNTVKVYTGNKLQELDRF